MKRNIAKFLSALFCFLFLFISLNISSSNSLNYKYSTQYNSNRIVTSNNVLGLQTTKSITSIRKSAWIPHFDFSNGLKSAKLNKSEISQIHYTGVSLDSSGKVQKVVSYDSNLNQLIKEDFLVGVNIFSENPDHISKFISSSSAISQIKAVLPKSEKVFAVNLNFEKLNSIDSLKFLNFLASLKSDLNQSGINLYLTVYPQTNVFSDYTLNSLSNISSLEKVIDKLVIMFYDYKILNPGANYGNSPLKWIDDLLSKITQSFPANKLAVGLPLYGYEFNDKNQITRSLTYNQLKLQNIEILYDNDLGEYYFTRGSFRVYFQNQVSINQRLQILKNYRIEDVFYWRLGGDESIGF